MLSKRTLKDLIEKYAAKHGLLAATVYAVVMAESGGDPGAARYESHWRWFSDPNKKLKPRTCSDPTEKILQMISIGLMQVMGANYREMGYQGWLTALFADPDAQMDYGCKFLKGKVAKYGLDGGISAYNAGSPTSSNQAYVDKVKRLAVAWPAFVEEALSETPAQEQGFSSEGLKTKLNDAKSAISEVLAELG